MKFNNPQTMAKVGTPTTKAVIHKSESYKLHQAFPVKSGQTIIQGQPVALNTDGTIQPYYGTGVFLGIAVTNSEYPAYPATALGVEVTVMVQAYAIVYGLAQAALDAGPVVPVSLSEDSIYVTYKRDEAEGHPTFISINPATEANELIQILVR